MSTAPDGHIYALPQWADCYHCTYPDKLWINSTWLKKLGLQVPKTTEDLRNVLLAFKTKDPNGNGKADEIPMTTDVQDSSLIALPDERVRLRPGRREQRRPFAADAGRRQGRDPGELAAVEGGPEVHQLARTRRA